MSRPRILFVAARPTSFVRDDLALLEERYDVSPLWFDPSRPLAQFGSQAHALRTSQADLVYGWFADYPMVLPVRWARRHGVPSVVALGGYDAVQLPSLRYGVYESRWRAPLARAVCRQATHLVPVAEALLRSRNAFATWPDVTEQGVRAHVPDLATPSTVIPTGYDPDAWPRGDADRLRSVLTVAHVPDDRTFRLKGLDLLAEAAARLPDVPFTVVGVAPGAASRAVPPNLSLLPPVDRPALSTTYRSASVYVQASRSEGLPNALCEAMLSGCVPVVSAVGGMPEAVGGVGTIVDRPEAAALAEAITHVLDSADEERRRRVRARVAERYTTERRRTALFGLIDRLIEEA